MCIRSSATLYTVLKGVSHYVVHIRALDRVQAFGIECIAPRDLLRAVALPFALALAFPLPAVLALPLAFGPAEARRSGGSTRREERFSYSALALVSILHVRQLPCVPVARGTPLRPPTCFLTRGKPAPFER